MTTLTTAETNHLNTLRANNTPLVLQLHTVYYYDRKTTPLDDNFRPIHSTITHTDRVIFGGIDDAIDWFVSGHDYDEARAARLICRACEFTFDTDERNGNIGRVYQFMRSAEGAAYAAEMLAPIGIL